MDNKVIDFAKRKEDADRATSHLIGSFDLFLNSDSSAAWASVSNVDEADLDAEWHRFIADQLRRLAWISDCMAADLDGVAAPVATISLFEDSRISTRWNDHLVKSKEHVGWIREQLSSGVDEIEI